MKVGNLVKYSQEWVGENMFHEEEQKEKAGFGIVIKKNNEDWGEVYYINWSGDGWHTWEYESDLEIISESR